MKAPLILMVLLLAPQLAAAKVYMCVDPNTGKTSFTDKGCETVAFQEEVRVGAVNSASGKRSSGGKTNKAWNSERETRKSGIEYNEQRKRERRNNATASVTHGSEFDGS
jgi:Domain of unknown function (DUF4124)